MSSSLALHHRQHRLRKPLHRAEKRIDEQDSSRMYNNPFPHSSNPDILESSSQYIRPKKLIEYSTFLPFIRPRSKRVSYTEAFDGSISGTFDTDSEAMYHINECQSIIENLKKLTRYNKGRADHAESRYFGPKTDKLQPRNQVSRQSRSVQRPQPQPIFFRSYEENFAHPLSNARNQHTFKISQKPKALFDDTVSKISPILKTKNYEDFGEFNKDSRLNDDNLKLEDSRFELSAIKKIKEEKQTPWVPNPEDSLFTSRKEKTELSKEQSSHEKQKTKENQNSMAHQEKEQHEDEQKLMEQENQEQKVSDRQKQNEKQQHEQKENEKQQHEQKENEKQQHEQKEKSEQEQENEEEQEQEQQEEQQEEEEEQNKQQKLQEEQKQKQKQKQKQEEEQKVEKMEKEHKNKEQKEEEDLQQDKQKQQERKQSQIGKEQQQTSQKEPEQENKNEQKQEQDKGIEKEQEKDVEKEDKLEKKDEQHFEQQDKQENGKHIKQESEHAQQDEGQNRQKQEEEGKKQQEKQVPKSEYEHPNYSPIQEHTPKQQHPHDQSKEKEEQTKFESKGEERESKGKDVEEQEKRKAEKRQKYLLKFLTKAKNRGCQLHKKIASRRSKHSTLQTGQAKQKQQCPCPRDNEIGPANNSAM